MRCVVEDGVDSSTECGCLSWWVVVVGKMGLVPWHPGLIAEKGVVSKEISVFKPTTKELSREMLE